MDFHDPSKEVWYILEISNKKNVNLRKLKENSSRIDNLYPDKNNIIKKKGKGTLTFQISMTDDKVKKLKKENTIRANSYDIWGLVMDKIKDCPIFYFNQKFFYDYLRNYIEVELKFYKKVEKIVRLILKMDKERKIQRKPGEIKLIQSETEEILTQENKEQLNELFLKDDTIEILDSQNIIHTYELN